MSNGVTDPISAGQIIATYNATSINNTDWNTLTSNDFYDPVSGNQLDANLKFAFVGIESNNTSSICYLKLRARTAANDSILNAGGVIPVFSSFNVDSQALSEANITSIAYKKASNSDTVVLYCGFNR